MTDKDAKDTRSPGELMAVALGGVEGERRQRIRNVATWRQSVAKTNPKVERPSAPSAKHRTVDMNLKTPPQQQTLALGFYLEPQRPTESVLHARPIDNRIGPGFGKPKLGPGCCMYCGKEGGVSFPTGKLAHGECIAKECPDVIPVPFGGHAAVAAAEARVAARKQPIITNGRGIKKAPPGDVWWVSEVWSKCNDRWRSPSRAGDIWPEPPRVEFTMLGMQLETGVGNQGSKGAMYAHAGREAKRRQQAFLTTRSKCQQFVGWPVRITLTRISPCELDDDNLGTAFKRIRDGICEALGFRDDKNRDGYLQWHYAQEKGGKRKDKMGSAVAHVKVKVEVLR